MKIRKLINENRYFLVPYLFTLIICGFLLIIFAKPELHIFSNKANSVFFDYFFKYATYLGDGAMIVILTIILLFIKYRYAIVFFIGGLLTGGIINLFKKVILDDVFRPSKYFELYETHQLHFIEGVNLHSLNSFPSGHTGTAFNVFFMLAIIAKTKMQKLFFFIIAALVAYSRVYLSQHFLIDITVGSAIGTTVILLLFWWFSKSNKTWFDNSLIRKNE